MKNSHHKIESLIAPIVSAMGYEVWSIDIRKAGRKTLLAVYVDVPQHDARGAINIDDCGEISKQLGALFEVEDLFAGSYVLEVSSPGLNRSLSKLEHYQRYMNSKIHVVLIDPLDEKMSFTGEIKEVSDGMLKLLVDDSKVVSLLLTNIKRANLVPCF